MAGDQIIQMSLSILEEVLMNSLMICQALAVVAPEGGRFQ
ncbi:hypothetical protein EHW99_0542 [Erwinia amylovora]|uniref:Uncharacterized protein n=2 Tax=Erwinia amylovora TaxID=552 RepID=A0A831A110_ERWAM|nr:hypothetical protein EaACW_3089 [Erwinia amylovora ACW56400]QJQ53249.1 hypothetical protein EHX00_0542 [Erwinia amylovora]CBA22953.1 hypothetical protein predicted by Glimmer/Critica [Erwinia amylovora CFBP1430]CBJ45212.1 hypothetical protein EAM_0537 [Erwinia amylovora ATCC 49946]CCO79930.1 hypothetical protein BN432_3155 [Erwinia amylovora Ea356]CCO83735.1 hypothetical protein BN433_3181 [Erwinia amylovora Ea266]CCO87496.1 hypothetical protein BN434_3131 [Erwinia amylovora CFBP 2585]CCO